MNWKERSEWLATGGPKKDDEHQLSAAALCSIAGSLEVLAKESQQSQYDKDQADAQRRAMGGIK